MPDLVSVAVYSALTGVSCYVVGSAVTWCLDRLDSNRGYRSGNAAAYLAGGPMTGVEVVLYLGCNRFGRRFHWIICRRGPAETLCVKEIWSKRPRMPHSFLLLSRKTIPLSSNSLSCMAYAPCFFPSTIF